MTPDEIVRVPGVRQAAFFDLEKTLTPHAVEQEVALILARRRELPLASLLRVLFIYVQYDLGLISNFEDMKRFGAVLFEKRDHARDVGLMRALFDERLHRFIYPQARAVVDRFKALGFELYIVSSTYRFMAKPYADALGIERLHGVDLELDAEGRCTGRLTGTIFHQHKKAEVLQQAAREGISLADSWAFGDSINDLPMLDAVGHPVPVNPGKKLRNAARQRGWNSAAWKMPG